MGQDAYPGLHEKAAVLLESIVRNPPLIDGNKRLGWMAVFVFHGLNGADPEAAEHLARWTRPGVTPLRDPAGFRFGA